MPSAANETVLHPFTNYNFAIEIAVPGVGPKLCNASFQECDGLDINLEIKTIREGGNNGRQIRLMGPATYGQITLKRGMTASFDLWNWFSAVLQATATKLRTDLRGEAEVVLFAPDGTTERARFLLSRCVPLKLKAPALNAKDGIVAIEELQIAFESLTLKPGASQGGA